MISAQPQVLGPAAGCGRCLTIPPCQPGDASGGVQLAACGLGAWPAHHMYVPFLHCVRTFYHLVKHKKQCRHQMGGFE